MSSQEDVLFHSGGVPVTQSMVDAVAEQWESGELPGDGWGPVRRGWPLSVGDGKPAVKMTFRLGSQRKQKLERLAEERHTNPSEVVRQLIDAA
jgi:hypothetical protein